ncbi:hypothetical protein RJ640_030367 [Escallonia rubra]|uniref:Uncharacterized protein n=1 Tax=Escallonia rubra TaxID=112253 RepID=A0AA88UB65_9ASTE|nr:hypothetical protein RJ640_030367 [Escallonia rubra]
MLLKRDFFCAFLQARAGITEVHFLPFNPVEKSTAITYIDSTGNWHRSSKGAPEQIIDLCELKGDARKRAHEIIDNFANRGLRSLAVGRQRIRLYDIIYRLPEKTKESAGSPWEFVGLLPLFDPPRHDSAETIRKALDLGVNGKMITGDQLAIGKETGRRLGMGTNMYPSSSLLGQSKDESIASIPVDELIEKADGFAGVFPGDSWVGLAWCGAAIPQPCSPSTGSPSLMLRVEFSHILLSPCDGYLYCCNIPLI